MDDLGGFPPIFGNTQVYYLNWKEQALLERDGLGNAKKQCFYQI